VRVLKNWIPPVRLQPPPRRLNHLVIPAQRRRARKGIQHGRTSRKPDVTLARGCGRMLADFNLQQRPKPGPAVMQRDEVGNWYHED
jgi:hypothetical protein